MTDAELLALAAAVENASEHPLAAAVLEYAEAVIEGGAASAQGEEALAAEHLEERRGSSQAAAMDKVAPAVGLPAPVAHPERQRRSRRTDWIRDVRDAEPSVGAS